VLPRHALPHTSDPRLPLAKTIAATARSTISERPCFNNWAKQKANFLRQIPRHAYKSDFGVVDMTGASQDQINDVMDFYGTLDSTTRSRLIIINGTYILN